MVSKNSNNIVFSPTSATILLLVLIKASEENKDQDSVKNLAKLQFFLLCSHKLPKSGCASNVVTSQGSVFFHCTLLIKRKSVEAYLLCYNSIKPIKLKKFVCVDFFYYFLCLFDLT